MVTRPTRRISSLRILVGAVAVIPLYFRDFARTLVVPFVLYLCFDALWLIPVVARLYERLPWLLFPLSELIEIVLYTIVAVATHRIILLGPSSVRKYAVEWTRYTTHFLALAIVLTFVIYTATYVLPLVARGSLLITLAAAGGICFVIARLLLVLPTTAIGHPISFRRSWELTRGRKLLMCLIAFVYPALIALPTYYVSSREVWAYLLESVAGVVVLVITVSLLSLAYQQILKEREGAASTRIED